MEFTKTENCGSIFMRMGIHGCNINIMSSIVVKKFVEELDQLREWKS